MDKTGKKNKKNIDLAFGEFLGFLNDDINVPRALSYMWEILRDDRLAERDKYEIVLRIDKIFSLDLGKEEKITIPEKVKKLADLREKLRKEKRWEEADDVRTRIKKLGFVVEDIGRGYKIKKV